MKYSYKHPELDGSILGMVKMENFLGHTLINQEFCYLLGVLFKIFHEQLIISLDGKCSPICRKNYDINLCSLWLGDIGTNKKDTTYGHIAT